MSANIKNRIDELKRINNINSDTELITRIYKYKKIIEKKMDLDLSDYIDKNKGSFSQCFNGKRNFKTEDYLAIESVLNSSMAYIIYGKGEITKDYQPKGIRYAAYVDQIGNYEELVAEDVIGETDEYHKYLFDYMIEFESVNGFKFFAERNLLPLSHTGGFDYFSNHLGYLYHNQIGLLLTLIKVLPANLLKNYFDGFFTIPEIFNFAVNANQNTCLMDEVIAEAINNSDLRKEVAKTKKVNLDTFNNGNKRRNNTSYGEGLFVNYVLTTMIKYVLTHDVEDEIREELLESAIRINNEVFKHYSTFKEEELKLNKLGFITDVYERIFYGSIVVPVDASVKISDKANSLLFELNRQVHNYHELIANNSKISTFENTILADKKNNQEYYDFFKLMNTKGVGFIPLYKERDSNDKDLFEVTNNDKSSLANSTEYQLKDILKTLKEIDDISNNVLNGKTYCLIDPSIYMMDEKVNYIMPRDVVVSNRYSNLVHFLNEYALWNYVTVGKRHRIASFIRFIKEYGIPKEELDEFFDEFLTLSLEESRSFDTSSERGKELALKVLENKSWVEIYRDDIVKAF